jgi:uncharacterized protein YggE
VFFLITVSGEGKVAVTPDRAIITLGVITERNTLSDAQKENSEKITSIVHSLIMSGVQRENIKTSEFRMEPQYDYVDGKQVFRGYKVTHLLQVTTDEVASSGKIVDTAVAQGANYVSNIQLTVSAPEVFYNQALSLALHNSLRKAETLAQTMGVALMEVPLEIQEVTQPFPQPILYQTARETPTPIQPGEVTIVARLTAKYHYH